MEEKRNRNIGITRGVLLGATLRDMGYVHNLSKDRIRQIVYRMSRIGVRRGRFKIPFIGSWYPESLKKMRQNKRTILVGLSLL